MLHRGNVWVDFKGNEARLPTAATIQERDSCAKAQATDASASRAASHPNVQLVAGRARSRSAKYQFVGGTCPVGSVGRPLKLASWALWDAMKRPRFVCAPMVEQSELPFRMLCRKYGTTLAYTPMFHARLFIEDDSYRKEQFTTCPADRPLVVQFCANDADMFATAAAMVEGQCDAVDLNLGCPQGIAKKGHYGSFLMEDMELIYKLINTAHTNSNVPITAKMRVFEDDDKSLQYAKMLQDAGAQLITVHGRTRDNKGATATPADWNIIRKIKEHVGVPVISNGNIVSYQDGVRCLLETKADAVMSAEWLRRNPALFAGEEAQYQDPLAMTLEYLDLCTEYPVPVGFMRSHCFKFLLEQLNVCALICFLICVFILHTRISKSLLQVCSSSSTSVSLYVSLYVSLCVSLYVSLCWSLYIYVYVYIYACIHIYIHTHIYIHMCVCVCLCVYCLTCVRVRMYVCVCVCVCV